MEQDNIVSSDSKTETVGNNGTMKDDGDDTKMVVDGSDTVITNGVGSLKGPIVPPTTASDAGAVGEQFLQLAKSAKGAAAVQLIKEALEAPGLYVFAELLHMPNIKDLSSNAEHSAYYRLMDVFAYGVYDDYLQVSPALPPLTQPMLAKLRHLTIVTMASTNKSLQLDNLENKLGLNSRRELEDLIIEAIYADVLHGKLDQRASVLEVDYALGRDIKAEDLPNIAATLKAWCDTCSGLVGTLDDLVTSANKDKEMSLKKTLAIEAEVTKIKGSMKRQGDGSSEDGISQTECLDRELDRKIYRTKKNVNQSRSSSVTKSTSAKFWPK